jgi:hypothetical protein
MTNPRYEVISHERNGRTNVEGTFQTEWDAYKYADQVCKTYGPVSKQDLDDNDKIVRITINKVWVLEN